jgi:hypothetical protein
MFDEKTRGQKSHEIVPLRGTYLEYINAYYVCDNGVYM